MILDKEVEICVFGCNAKHFKNIGYKFEYGKKIFVKIEDLQLKSNIKINVQCDVCSKQKHISYCSYNKNTKNFTEIYSCRKCATQKIKNTCLNRYGIENYVNYEKAKKTNLEKYGVECVLQNNKVKNKSKQTKFNKYGDENFINIEKMKKTVSEKYKIDNVSKLGYIKEKKKNTSLNNWGTNSPTQNEKIKEKTRNTNIKKYGGCSPMCKKEIFEKSKETCKKNYGVEHNSQSKIIKDKKKTTSLKNYGTNHPMQNEKIFEKNQKSGLKIKIHQETGLYYRGSYEKHFLDYCFKNNVRLEKAPPVKYEFKDNQKIYYPDFYLKNKNLIIEIKSLYTYNKYLEKNLAKNKACIEKGYKHVFIIDKNYNNIII